MSYGIIELVIIDTGYGLVSDGTKTYVNCFIS